MSNDFLANLKNIIPPVPQATRLPVPRNYTLEELRDLNDALRKAAASNSASAFVERIAQQVRTFESALDPEHEVGASLVNFGQAQTIHVQTITALEPSLLVVDGLSGDRAPVQLLQHVSQISFLLVRVRRLDPDEPRRPIGFVVGPGSAPTAA